MMFLYFLQNVMLTKSLSYVEVIKDYAAKNTGEKLQMIVMIMISYYCLIL